LRTPTSRHVGDRWQPAPRYAVNATSLPHTAVWQDIEVISATGASGVPIGLELLAARRRSAIPTVQGMAEVLDQVGRDNIGIMFSVFHSWEEPDLLGHLLRHADRINSVQVCDIRDSERSSFDRELPGRGRGVAPGIMGWLLTAGYRGWWELEIFSDDGTFGAALPSPTGACPPDFLTQAKAAFDSS